MKVLNIKHEVKIFFNELDTKEVSLSYTEEHPGNEIPIWSLQAEKESCEDQMDELLEEQGYVLNKMYLRVEVLKTSISDGDNILEECEWSK